MSGNSIKFPADFLWGAATAAAQIEGGWNADDKGESIWDTFSHSGNRISNGDTTYDACDHYNRYREDVALMKSLGLKAYRFSISWPRVQPSGMGSFNQKGIDFYDRLVDELLANDIQPWTTLYHWDLPQQLHDIGGWTNRDVLDRFAEYAACMAESLGDRVKNWMTINEPWVITNLGYKTGEHAPGLKDERTALAVAHGLLVAHGKALQAVRASRSDLKAGIVLSLSSVEGASENAEDHIAAQRLWSSEVQWYMHPLLKGDYPQHVYAHFGNNAPKVEPGDLDVISQPMDFLGVNYYFRVLVNSEGIVKDFNPDAKYTEMGWEIHAPGFKRLLTRINREYENLPPLYITENGAAFNDTVSDTNEIDDSDRIEYMRDHIHAVANAMKAGVNIKGYFAWSLLDNFEWAHGYSKRFGLIYVDYPTQRRIIKNSGKWFAKVIKAGQIEVEDALEPEPAFYNSSNNLINFMSQT